MWAVWKTGLLRVFSEYPSRRRKRCRPYVSSTAVLIKSRQVLGALGSSAQERKLLMEIKVFTSPMLYAAHFMNKAKLFTSDLGAAFVISQAKEGLMLLLAV